MSVDAARPHPAATVQASSLADTLMSFTLNFQQPPAALISAVNLGWLVTEGSELHVRLNVVRLPPRVSAPNTRVAFPLLAEVVAGGATAD